MRHRFIVHLKENLDIPLDDKSRRQGGPWLETTQWFHIGAAHGHWEM
jgi:hypothetical protein